VLRRVTCVLRAMVRRTTMVWWPFIEARKGQAGRPVVCRPALPMASLAPRRSLASRLVGMSAPVGDDGTRAEEGCRVAMMRPASQSPPCAKCRPPPFASDALKVSDSCCPLTKCGDVGPTGLGGADWPTIWPFLLHANIIDAKQNFKCWFKIFKHVVVPKERLCKNLKLSYMQMQDVIRTMVLMATLRF
jgi:hypothetical protein